jgi:ABC-type phosphate/phosphonate transport system substrate-binding protein
MSTNIGRCAGIRRPSLLASMAAVATLLAVAGRAPAAEPAGTPAALTIVVMDPLSKPLSCPCVQGYAQRDYEKLAVQLQKELQRPVRVVFNESLKVALEGDAAGQAPLVIGKHSVVEFDAQRVGLKLSAVARLSGKSGDTHMTGLLVVPKDDPAKTVADLAGYRIFFGPPECDEKHAAPLALLKKHAVPLPEKLDISPSCTDGACQVLEDFKEQRRGAAVISSYAQPLLEGCGTIEKGALRVIATTAPVPFITAFVTEHLPQSEREPLLAALLKVTKDAQLRVALESRDGFVPIADGVAAKKK